jgi:hypothetical protein
METSPYPTPQPGGSLRLGLSRTTLLRSRMIIRVRVRVRVALRLAVYRQSVRLGVKPPLVHHQNFFKPNPCGHTLCVTSSLTRRWICFLKTRLAFVKCKYRT